MHINHYLWISVTEPIVVKRPVTNAMIDSPSSTPMTILDTAETEPEEETFCTANKQDERPNLIGVTLRIHEGRQTSCPYSVHPKQLVIENNLMF